MIDIILTLAIVVSAIFVIQFLVSILGMGIDMDVDLDSSFDTDIDSTGSTVGDLISFKGVLHFLLGFCWTLVLLKEVKALTVAVAIGVGILFVIVLYHVYKGINKLKSEPTRETLSDLVGRSCTIYCKLPNENGYMVSIVVNGLVTEKTVFSQSNTPYEVGDIVFITDCNDEFLFIE